VFSKKWINEFIYAKPISTLIKGQFCYSEIISYL